ncbi:MULTISPECIES: DUF2399 domain-containing protein [Pseudonocardia]|uniref:DUF2399 domain-containing protein n=2 Tax=Pseudonocardia TaxID=1847 RepID=A0A1Y2N9H1_PSEAH|nr:MULTISPECIES: DUF2399 domain-containing protein [Pseudonocardia]OSY44113.1 hypothetical protein BG845_00234 [Pseudonocardia autotrophica]TDN74157.1 uncharacterized protein DUF2399 [Pseudonocardia autotrophica]BBG04917.1 hypothetical protein Pdca_61260 [Pseudonocardia autotrophica]GEC23573.1 hypothetical protein PSA01_06020 [Pseudonocardia saturnea]
MSTPGPAALLAALRATGRTRIDRAGLWRAFLDAVPSAQGSAEARRMLAAALDELAGTGALTPTAATDDGVPPLPRAVRLTRPAAAPVAREAADPWHPELAAAAAVRAPAEAVRQVNRWLFAGGTRAGIVGLRERALEITGDEKAFDAGLPVPLTPEILRAERVALPMHRERLPGGGPVLLVVENADTFHSLLLALRGDPGPIGTLGWGAGSAFLSSVSSLAADPPAAIRYFGDLDAAGLRIPARASVQAQAQALPAVRPAPGLYRALLAHGRPAPAGPADHSDVEWLDPGLRGPVRELFATGHRMAQEAVDRRVLGSGRDWRDGLDP